MDWSKLEPLPEASGSLAEQNMVAVLNRRIADLAKFRAAATSDTPPSNRFFSKEDAVNEALRRELMLRVDIARFQKLKAEEVPEVIAVRKLLDERGGHRR